MKKQQYTILALIGFFSFLALAYTGYVSLSEQYSQDPGAETLSPSRNGAVREFEAPDFTVTDANGAKASLADFKGKPMIINFWASWCPPCKAEMPYFNEAFQELGSDVQFVMINQTDGTRETVDIAKAFIKEKGYAFPVYFDTTLDASIAYNATSLPSTFFVNSEGMVVAAFSGSITRDQLASGIEMLYK